MLLVAFIFSGLSVASADPIKLFGSAANFVALGTISSTEVTRQLYESCAVQDGNNVTTTGSICVALAVGHMLSTLAKIPEQQVLIINNTLSGNQRRDANQILHDFNGNPYEPTAHAIRAVDLLPSELHPHDGMAIRTNIESDNKVLYIHTNGSHAMATFESVSPRSRRDLVSDLEQTYSFSGVSGLKMQAIWKSNCTENAHKADMDAFGYGLAYGANGIGAALQQSDSWIYSVCPPTGSDAIFQGRLIAELYNPGWNYETGPYPSCA